MKQNLYPQGKGQQLKQKDIEHPKDKNIRNKQTKLALKRKEKILEKIEKDTGFEVICCSCNEFKSRTSCTKASVLHSDVLDKFVLMEKVFNE